MRRHVLTAAALGLLNAVVVLVLLVLIRQVEQAALDSSYTYGWFSYTPLKEYEPPSRFPWEYVLPPLALALLNGALAAVVLRRR